MKKIGIQISCAHQVRMPTVLKVLRFKDKIKNTQTCILLIDL